MGRLSLYLLGPFEVTLDGEPVSFIQEPRDKDGSLYVVMPTPLAEGQEYELDFTYASRGKKVIRSAGGGNYFVLARTSWYPSLNSFRDYATFELSFRYPKKLALVSVGNRIEEGKGKEFAYSKWSSDVPLAVAGFNLGRFKRREVKDDPTNYTIEGFAAANVPDIFRQGELSADLPVIGGL